MAHGILHPSLGDSDKCHGKPQRGQLLCRARRVGFCSIVLCFQVYINEAFSGCCDYGEEVVRFFPLR